MKIKIANIRLEGHIYILWALHSLSSQVLFISINCNQREDYNKIYLLSTLGN